MFMGLEASLGECEEEERQISADSQTCVTGRDQSGVIATSASRLCHSDTSVQEGRREHTNVTIDCQLRHRLL